MDVDKWEITNLRDGAAAQSLADYINKETSATSFGSTSPKYIVSQLNAWYGGHA